MEERKPEESKPEHLKAVPPSLQQAVRRARVESAEQSEAVDDLRQAEIVRLELLADAISVTDKNSAASGPVDVDVATGCAGYRVDVRSDAVSR